MGEDTNICKNSLPYTLRAPAGYDTYRWSNGTTADSLQVYDAGTYWVECSLNGCGEISDTITISYINSPKLDIGRDTLFCKGSSFSVHAQSGFDSYLWNTSDSTKSILIDSPGLYKIEAKDVCGTQKDSIEVSMDSVPEITIDIGNDTTLCNNEKNQSLILYSNIELSNYHWSNGGKTSQITVSGKGEYWLESHFYCAMLKSNIVFVDECPPDTIELYIPNSFTPNNDGMNDFFEPIPHNVTLLKLEIYNSWVSLIYENHQDFKWDGMEIYLPYPADKYVFRVIFKDKNGKMGEKAGTVKLLR